MTQRSANKASFSLKWDCVIKGENSIHGAVREVCEDGTLLMVFMDGTKIECKNEEE